MSSADLDNSNLGQGQGRFLRWVDWSAFWTALILSFGVYFYTLAPSVTLEDSGELIVAGDYLGVPHPPGYPIWSMISWVFARVFSFVTFRGQPNPAWAINLVSAVFGALAAGFSAMLICRSGSDLLRQFRSTLHANAHEAEDAICWVAAVVGSLLFAFSPVMWSQSVIAEVYSLNAFFLVVVFLLSYRWLWRPTDSILYLTGFVFGLGLTNYQVLLLAALALIVVIMLKDLDLFRAFAIIGGPFVLVILMMSKGYLPPISDPTTIDAFFYVALNILWLTVAYFFIPHGKVVAGTILATELGVAFYAYMPLVSDLRNPPMNWGYPRTWEGFKHAVSRGQYEKIQPIMFADMFTGKFVQQLGSYLVDLRTQFTLPLALLGFLPFTLWRLKIKSVQIRALPIAVGLCIAGTALLGVERFLSMAGYNPWRLDKAVLLGVILLVACGGLTILVNQCLVFSDTLRQRDRSGWREPWLNILGLVVPGIALLAIGIRLKAFSPPFVLAGMAALAYMVNARYQPSRGSERQAAPRTAFIEALTSVWIFVGIVGAYAFLADTLFDLIGSLLANLNLPVEQRLPAAEDRDLIRHIGILIAVLLLPAMATAALTAALRRRVMAVTMDTTSQKWVLATLCGFLMMSIMLIVLANPRGDIQDSFIQRVKFISSHAFYALWIGYGLIFALAWLDTLMRGNRLLRLASLAVALHFITWPLLSNAYNDALIFEYGGAEQNDHDYGWQFGNYQLRGATAITEELSPDEEPLPNPEFPLEMTTNAVFYGGTDPGRFVPTYMIYSARVREDVYLITQNALADNTYMNVMRDLYGDQIWIPSILDSQSAFGRYVNEVQSGKRPPNAQLTIEDGRVQVSGALGVMEINGILAEMIFERNRFRHDFYIEESYVIPWMYPYLTPHGLIMKLENALTPLSTDMIHNDNDFWDWYTRRFLNDPKFTRDVTARKSFSKLRSAISGLYASRGRLAEAENGFQQSRLLYPLSPEANFRLVQEVLIRQGRMEEILGVMQNYKRLDPRNDRVDEFIRQILRIETLNKDITEIESRQSAEGRIDVASLLRLAQLYRDAQQKPRYLVLLRGLIDGPDISSPYYYETAVMLHQSKDYFDMERALDKFLRDVPDAAPPEIYLNLARMFMDARQPLKMANAMELYVARNPSDWKAWLDVASLRLALQQTNGALEALRMARQYGGQQADAMIEQDDRFGPARFDPAARSPVAAPLPTPASRPPLPGVVPGS